MNTVEEELTSIEQNAEKALRYIKHGKLDKALRLARKCRRSWAVLEGERAAAIIEAAIHFVRREPTKARELCLDSMSYLWNEPEALFFIRATHPEVDAGCFWFEIALNGGAPSVGMPEDQFSGFLVCAADEFEALSYIDEVTKGSPSPNRHVVIQRSHSVSKSDRFDCRGVYVCTPFSTEIPELDLLGWVRE